MREGEIEQLQDHILESHKDMFRVAVLGHYLLPDDSEIQEDFLNELIKHFQDEQANN